MSRRIAVRLWGKGNRKAMIDPSSTAGATVGRDLRWEDGSIVQEEEIRGSGTGGTSNTTIVGGVSKVPTLWDLIIGIPAFIQSLAALGGTGIVVKGAGDSAVTRTITPEDERITVANGDGVSGNPTIGASDWPRVREVISSGATVNIWDEFQMLVVDTLDIEGTLNVEGTVAII